MIGSPKCGCGKTMHPPYCDGSHARNEQQYKEWQDKCDLEAYQKQAQELWADSCTTPRSNNDSQ